MHHFTDLKVWKGGIELVKEVYRLTKKFPKTEIYELSAQLRTASTSILANYAEGFGRFTHPDKANKFIISRGESAEVEAELHIAISLGFITEEDAQKALNLSQEVGKMLSGLIRFYQKKP